MSKKDNLSKGVQDEFADIDYWHKLPRNRYVTLPNGEKISEYEWMKKAMHEMYANNFSRSNPDSNILQTDEQKEWARRNNNNTNRDALNVIKKANKMSTIFHLEEEMFKDSGKEKWEDDFKTGNYGESFKSLIDFSAEELGLTYTREDTKAILRMYFRIRKFLKMLKHDRKIHVKKCKVCKTTKPVSEFRRHNSSRDGYVKKCKGCYETL